jgi:hypothetical protein
MRNALGRLNADGSLDTFNPGASKPSGVPIVYTMARQPDGKVVVGGYFTGLGGGSGATARNYIGRIRADGALDTSFDPGSTFYASALALQVDGRILVGGNFIGLGGVDVRVFIRWLVLLAPRQGHRHRRRVGVDDRPEPAERKEAVAPGARILLVGFSEWIRFHRRIDPDSGAHVHADATGCSEVQRKSVDELEVTMEPIWQEGARWPRRSIAMGYAFFETPSALQQPLRFDA